MRRLLITYIVLMTLLSCSRKQEDVHDAKLFSLAYLHQLRVFDNLDSLPDNLDSVYRLNLTEKKLNKLPEIVLKLSNLQELDISHNQISDLKGIEGLKQLQIINIGMNVFNSFPSEITELKNLKVLDLWWNNIKTFPVEFFKNNSQIEELNMTSMFEFDFVTNMSQIHLFKNLKILNLGNNQIPQLTIQFDKLDSLEVFGYISQDSFDIKDLIQRLSNCKKLKSVHFSANHIKELPTEITLLENLETLNLFQNELKELPIDIIKMKNLKEIKLIDNPVNGTKIKETEIKMPQTKIIY